ncbi:MAG: hypothetical protein ACLFM1_04370 [Bacteroidales bacterium]
MKTTKIFFIISLAFFACQHPENKIKPEPTDIKEAAFIWKSDSLGDYYHKHSKILIPVEFERPYTRKSYLSLNNGLGRHSIYHDFADTVGELKSKDTSMITVDNVSGKLGEIDFGPVAFQVSKRTGSEPDSIAGEISLDFFKGRDLLIDFKDGCIQIADYFPWSEKMEFVEYQVYHDDKILIPVKMSDLDMTFLLNPESTLFVVFNPECDLSEIRIATQIWQIPDRRSISDPNPAFDGILGYSFLKDKKLLIRPDDSLIAILDSIPE